MRPCQNFLDTIVPYTHPPVSILHARDWGSIPSQRDSQTLLIHFIYFWHWLFLRTMISVVFRSSTLPQHEEALKCDKKLPLLYTSTASATMNTKADFMVTKERKRRWGSPLRWFDMRNQVTEQKKKVMSLVNPGVDPSVQTAGAPARPLAYPARSQLPQSRVIQSPSPRFLKRLYKEKLRAKTLMFSPLSL